MALGPDLMSGFKGTKENDLFKAQNRTDPPFMSDFKDIDPNINIDGCWDIPADTISDSDVGNLAVGPLAIIMLVTFVTVALNVMNSMFVIAYNAHSTFIVMIVFLMLTKGSCAMDPEEIHKIGEFNAAAAGISTGLILIAGATVHCGSESDHTRKRKVRRGTDDAGTSPGLVPMAQPKLLDDTATKCDVPDLAANSDSDDEDDGALVGERHSNARGLPADACLQHDAPVSVPVITVHSERDHAMSNHPAPFNRCVTCHRKSECDPLKCELHLGLLQKVRTCRRRLFHDNYIAAASLIASVHLQARIARESRALQRNKVITYPAD